MNVKNALILGANGSIGEALVKEIRNRFPSCHITGTFRGSRPSAPCDESVKLDVGDEASWEEFANFLGKSDKEFELIISAVGMLENSTINPEKSLKDISLKSMEEVFKVNCFHAPMLAKLIKTHLGVEVESRLVFLSAMVGSIEDNKMGGWYSYRASKTALNMFVRNISIELARRFKNHRVFAIHPGTTETSLSKGHLSSVKHKIWRPEETANHVLDQALQSSYETGSFINWDGERLAW